MTGQELYEHVQHLSQDLGVRVWVAMAPDSYSEDPAIPFGEAGIDDDGERAIWLSHAPDEPRAYLVALHELGHIATSSVSGGRTRDREARAWRWALAHALIEITAQEWRWVKHYLCSYSGPRYKESDEFTSLLQESERHSYEFTT